MFYNLIIIKRAVFVCVFLMLFGPILRAQQRQIKTGIDFIQQDFHAALKQARQQHKLIFVDAYAVWCAPCKQLKKETFTDSKVAAYFNSHFVNVSIDIEKRDGENFAEVYEVNSYPTLLFFDENGVIINKTEGFINAKTLRTLANTFNK